MTKLEALKALAEKVEAGCVPKRDLVSAAFAHRDEKYKGFRLGELIHWIMQPDDIRAMGAAKALHEAVLHERVFVEIEWSKRYEEESRVTLNMGKDGWISASDNPARAWLLAIIKALIAQEALQDLADADRDLL